MLVIDHHQTQESWGSARLVDATASSAAEVVWRCLRGLFVNLTPAMAQATFVGLVSDTGWFQFSNTSPSALRLAADLIERGANPDTLYQRLYLSEREARLRLQARALQSLSLSASGRLAVMHLSPQDFTQASATPADTENLINLPLSIASVQMSVLLVLASDTGQVRVSCRSKGLVDVARFAERFGGGGHARASGLRVDGPLEAAIRKIRVAAEQEIESGGGGVVV